MQPNNSETWRVGTIIDLFYPIPPHHTAVENEVPFVTFRTNGLNTNHLHSNYILRMKYFINKLKLFLRAIPFPLLPVLYAALGEARILLHNVG